MTTTLFELGPRILRLKVKPSSGNAEDGTFVDKREEFYSKLAKWDKGHSASLAERSLATELTSAIKAISNGQSYESDYVYTFDTLNGTAKPEWIHSARFPDCDGIYIHPVASDAVLQFHEGVLPGILTQPSEADRAAVANLVKRIASVGQLSGKNISITEITVEPRTPDGDEFYLHVKVKDCREQTDECISSDVKQSDLVSQWVTLNQEIFDDPLLPTIIWQMATQVIKPATHGHDIWNPDWTAFNIHHHPMPTKKGEGTFSIYARDGAVVELPSEVGLFPKATPHSIGKGAN
jgi:hypothetical protein